MIGLRYITPIPTYLNRLQTAPSQPIFDELINLVLQALQIHVSPIHYKRKNKSCSGIS